MWTPYDCDNRDANPLPPRSVLVWIHDEFYHGVTLGNWNGWWETYFGSDDIGVTHWMPISYPDPPK